jgi:hypothetical protein
MQAKSGDSQPGDCSKPWVWSAVGLLGGTEGTSLDVLAMREAP